MHLEKLESTESNKHIAARYNLAEKNDLSKEEREAAIDMIFSAINELDDIFLKHEKHFPKMHYLDLEIQNLKVSFTDILQNKKNVIVSGNCLEDALGTFLSQIGGFVNYIEKHPGKETGLKERLDSIFLRMGKYLYRVSSSKEVLQEELKIGFLLN